MAKLIAFARAGQPDYMIWIHPDAVEMVRSNGSGNTIVSFRSGDDTITLAGEPDFIVAKLNSASD